MKLTASANKTQIIFWHNEFLPTFHGQIRSGCTIAAHSHQDRTIVLGRQTPNESLGLNMVALTAPAQGELMKFVRQAYRLGNFIYQLKVYLHESSYSFSSK